MFNQHIDSDLDNSTDHEQLGTDTSSKSDLETGRCTDESSSETNPCASQSHTDFFVFPMSISQPDSLCLRLNKLIEMGLIPKDKILYKFLNDITHILIDPNHAYDPQVIEFFNTVQYLGGERTVNFIRGPMWQGFGRGGKRDPKDAQMNFGGPSISVMQKQTSGYTTRSGVLKPWLLAMQKMCEANNENTFVNNNAVSVTAVCYANDSTALKASIAFDEKQALNIGLMNEVDLTFIKENPNPSPTFLRDNVVTEANITCLTTADNLSSMPVAVTYMTKKGKTGEYVKSQILQEVRIIQTCLDCVKESKSRCSIIEEKDISHCDAFCEDCVQEKVCDNCTLQGQKSTIPALRACKKCIRKDKKCIKLVVLLVAADCEQGNKSAFEQFIKDRNTDGIDLGRFMFSVLPDPVHVGKSLKASFANWPIVLENQRSCLTQLQTLRETKSEFKRLLPSSAVVNKDRMDVSAIVHLTKDSVLTFLSGLGPLVHSIVPDRHKLSDSNKQGLYPHPIAICCGKDG